MQVLYQQMFFYFKGLHPISIIKNFYIQALFLGRTAEGSVIIPDRRMRKKQKRGRNIFFYGPERMPFG